MKRKIQEEVSRAAKRRRVQPQMETIWNDSPLLSNEGAVSHEDGEQKIESLVTEHFFFFLHNLCFERFCLLCTELNFDSHS